MVVANMATKIFGVIKYIPYLCNRKSCLNHYAK